MTTERKSSTGCWTCRIRRKKCDNVVPVCRACGALEIKCYHEEHKPEWMDNGTKQQEMAQKVKSEIRCNASRRRGRRKLQILARDIGAPHLGNILESSASPAALPRPSPERVLGPGEDVRVSSGRTASELASGPQSEVSLLLTTSTSYDQSPRLDFSGNIPPPPRNSNSPAVQSAQRPDQLLLNQLELIFIMAYLDYVFPISYPFYRPTILEGGRSWLLTSVLGNKCLYHTVIGLTSYFFTVVKVNPGPAQQICGSYSWEALKVQTELALKKARCDLQELSHNGFQINVLESAKLMESVVHLLSIEAMLGSNENWHMHLDAANLLFQQLVDSHGKDEPCAALSHILEGIGDLTFKSPPDAPLWSPDQAAFRFFSAMLIFNDIVAGTSLGQSPKLREYHSQLLGKDLGPEPEPPLQLADVVGCQNWALVAIGEIASLDAWKKSMKNLNQLSVTELVQRGWVIEQLLHDGLGNLDTLDLQQDKRGSVTQLDELSLHPPCAPDTINTITRIWALSASSYLFTTISGWQLGNAGLRANVAQTVSLLSDLKASPKWLRTLAWPLCITGCLSSVEEEVLLRRLLAEMGSLKAFGTLRQAQSIMENVWHNRSQIDTHSWDFAACLSCLGHRVLLV